MVPMMFVGFDIIAQTAKEIRVDQKKIGILIMSSVICGVIFYASIIVSVGSVLGSEAQQFE